EWVRIGTKLRDDERASVKVSWNVKSTTLGHRYGPLGPRMPVLQSVRILTTTFHSCSESCPDFPPEAAPGADRVLTRYVAKQAAKHYPHLCQANAIGRRRNSTVSKGSRRNFGASPLIQRKYARLS